MTDDTDHPTAPWQHAGIQFWSIDYIGAPPATVFAYLTRGEHTARYYFGMAINDPAAVGDPVWFGPDEAKSPIRGQVAAFEAPTRFAHTFAFGHFDEPATTVEFTLHQHGPAVTRLETRHYGFDSTDSGTYNDICSGWPAILSGLKTLLETGEGLPWPEGEDG